MFDYLVDVVLCSFWSIIHSSSLAVTVVVFILHSFPIGIWFILRICVISTNDIWICALQWETDTPYTFNPCILITRHDQNLMNTTRKKKVITSVWIVHRSVCLISQVIFTSNSEKKCQSFAFKFWNTLIIYGCHLRDRFTAFAKHISIQSHWKIDSICAWTINGVK